MLFVKKGMLFFNTGMLFVNKDLLLLNNGRKSHVVTGTKDG